MSLQWRLAPQHVQVSMGDGSINLSLPSGSGPYAVTNERGDGHTDIGLAVDPKASRSIRLHMGDGDISIH